MRTIAGHDELEDVVGSRVLPSMLKTIPDLDHHCERLLGLSPIGAIGWTEPDGTARTAVVGGYDGFAVPAALTQLDVPLPPGVTPPVGSAVSFVFLIPGLGETLRVNGTAAAIADGTLSVAVLEAFAHCAKCVLRSKLWTTTDTSPNSGDSAVAASPPREGPAEGPLSEHGVTGLLGRAPFVVLSSRDGTGELADASPKGDPPGFVQVLDGNRVALPDRPGNRRTDTFHNVLERPAVGLLALVPGEGRVVELTGTASVTDDAALLATMEVNGRVPKAAMVLDVAKAWVHEAPLLAQAGMWDLDRRVPKADLPKMSQVFVDHVKRNKTTGIAATAVRKGANERLLRAGLARDYEQNLY